MIRHMLAGFAAATMLTAAPLAANDGVPSVSAKDPYGMLSALTNAGYSAELGVDAVGDPQITVSGTPAGDFNFTESNSSQHIQWGILKRNY